MNRYTYRAEWSSEYGEYAGRCIELPWLSQWAPTMQNAIASVEQAVDAYIAECEAAGQDVPPPGSSAASSLSGRPRRCTHA
ncbi:MAG: hypothetical protein WBZ15_24350 [Mycobacterium sp.]|uniref:hypothetical protein n=1 Tax=Mycobacterium sp. TaxID=1785 RepID=UPI003C6726E9